MITLQESLSPFEFGNKAASLSRLIQYGENVPNGFVIHKDWFEAFQQLLKMH
jgi:phosphoenolpyruvate synthase/pyruvate phosphate dikinase